MAEPTVSRDLRITTHESFSDFSETEWNGLERGDFIFGDHRFLTALENGKCLGRRAGWIPRIYAARSGSKLVGVLPVYLKTNSYGEYIFDWAWANAAEQIGFKYYPKLVSTAPFTPATGPKILGGARDALIAAVMKEAEAASSLHFLFTNPNETEILRERGFLIRHSFQYHWRNRGWTSFDEFLGAMRSKRRSEIKRERAAVVKSGVTVECLTGDQLTIEHAETMYTFYESTIEKMSVYGHQYLTREFFLDIFARMKDSILLVLARGPDGAPVAGALNFYRGQALYGRYWGCLQEFRNLHFEVCYYKAIEWAVTRGFEIFEAGAQGEHKFNRGFVPSMTYSAHEIFDPRLREAVADFLEREKISIDEMFLDYKDHDPFQRA